MTMNSEVFDNITTGSFEKRFLNFMKLFSIKEIHIHYSGGGDSGGVDHITFFYSDDISPDHRAAIESSISNNLEEELSTAIYQRHGGFADGGGYSVDGYVLWNSTANLVKICGTDHYYSYNDDDEESEESTSEGWEDVLFDNSWDRNESIDRNYDLICVYYEITKNKLPDEFHNRLLMEAVEGDESAKNYISSL